MKYLIIFGLLICGFGQVHAQDNGSYLAKVKLGETLQYEDIGIEFVKVISDSRCPLNVDCIWEGEAKIQVSIFKKGKLIEQKEIIFSASGVVREQSNLLYNSKDIQILGLSLYPYPKTPDKILDEMYCLEVGIN